MTNGKNTKKRKQSTPRRNNIHADNFYYIKKNRTDKISYQMSTFHSDSNSVQNPKNLTILTMLIALNNISIESIIP